MASRKPPSPYRRYSILYRPVRLRLRVTLPRYSPVSIDGRSYELENPNPGDHFLLCTEIDSRTEDNHIDRDRLTFYNEEGEDVTELYDLRGGGM